MRGYLHQQRTEGVYQDVKGYIVVHQGISRHIREYRGIPGYTKVYQDFQCITRYIAIWVYRGVLVCTRDCCEGSIRSPHWLVGQKQPPALPLTIGAAVGPAVPPAGSTRSVHDSQLLCTLSPPRKCAHLTHSCAAAPPWTSSCNVHSSQF